MHSEPGACRKKWKGITNIFHIWELFTAAYDCLMGEMKGFLGISIIGNVVWASAMQDVLNDIKYDLER